MSLLQDLAVANRVLAAHGVLDGYGHISVRSETDPERYWISRSLAPELVTEEDLMEFDLDSRPIDQRGRAMYTERFIHGAVYRSRPDVRAVVHNHSPSIIPFGITKNPMRPVYHMSCFVGLGLPTFEIRDVKPDSDLLVSDSYLGTALARSLGGSPAALMRGHGAVVVGTSLAMVVGRSIYLEMNARLQGQAMGLAGPQGEINYLSEGEVKAATQMLDYERAWHLWRMRGLEQMKSAR
jgi:HCOMODA/2-hydroxy-3-carboxy-muconic semialdehyde decarboxylase